MQERRIFPERVLSLGKGQKEKQSKRSQHWENKLLPQKCFRPRCEIHQSGFREELLDVFGAKIMLCGEGMISEIFTEEQAERNKTIQMGRERIVQVRMRLQSSVSQAHALP